MVRNWLFIGNFLMLLFIAVSVFSQQKSGDNALLRKKVVLNVATQPLDKVLDLLSDQCGCYFTYNAMQINGDQKVSVTCNSWPLYQVLDTLLNNPIFTYQEIGNQVVIHPILSETVKDTVPDYAFHIIEGEVISRNTQRPLSFASIALKGSYMGVITNESGWFRLTLPKNHTNDTLIFSYMGYYNLVVPINDFPASGKIFLEEALVSIQEVIVRSKDPLFLINKAREQIANTHQTKAYQYEAFYRETIKTGNKYTIYSEALLEGAKPPMRRNFATDKVSVIKARKFTNIQQTDTFLVKLRGGLDACFQLDIVHQWPDFLLEDASEYYNFQLHDMVVWNDQLVYVIGFTQKAHIKESMLEGTIYIEAQNFAIVGADFYFAPEQLKRSSKMFVVRKSSAARVKPVKTSYSVKYVQIKGKYYTQYVRGALQLKVKKQKEVFSKNFSTQMEMVYTKYDTLPKETPPRKELFRTTSVFSDATEIYGTEFWNHQTIIQPEDDIMEAFKKSGFKIDVEETIK